MKKSQGLFELFSDFFGNYLPEVKGVSEILDIHPKRTPQKSESEIVYFIAFECVRRQPSPV